MATASTQTILVALIAKSMTLLFESARSLCSLRAPQHCTHSNIRYNARMRAFARQTRQKHAGGCAASKVSARSQLYYIIYPMSRIRGHRYSCRVDSGKRRRHGHGAPGG